MLQLFLLIGFVTAIFCLLLDKFVIKDETLSLTSMLNSANQFVSPLALGFIALSIGEEFEFSAIKKIGKKIIVITFLQAFLAVILVDIGLFIACYFLKLNYSIALCLGAIAAATAPAATLMVIHQYKAKGPLVDILLPVVAFDDAIGLVVFSISVAISKLFVSNGSSINFFQLRSFQ